VFGGVLKDHGINDEKQIQAMLADIQQQKAKNFAKCMEKQRALFDKEKSSTSPASTEPNSSNPSSQDSTKSQNKFSFLADDDESHDKDDKNDNSDKDNDTDNDSDNNNEKDQKKSDEDKW
jgi:hypothetical protein